MLLKKVHMKMMNFRKKFNLVKHSDRMNECDCIFQSTIHSSANKKKSEVDAQSMMNFIFYFTFRTYLVFVYANFVQL